MKVRKIINFGDAHIFRNKRHFEHKFLFDKFIDQLKEIKPDLIVITGDIIDSKVNISTEQVILLRELFINLSNISDLIVILGNHDLNLQNKDRENLISATVRILKNKTLFSIHLIEHSSFFLYNNKLQFAVWSCLDNQVSPFVVDKHNYIEDKYTIGLYHGAVKGCIADNGFTLSSGIDIEEFDKCNIVMMSDIHQQQSFRNNEINFSGSFLQTKLNEKEHGTYLLYIWDEDKKNYYPKVITLENKYSTIVKEIKDLKSDLKIENVYDEQSIKILYNNKEISKSEIIDYKNQLQQKFPRNKIEISPKLKKSFQNFSVIEEVLKEEKELSFENLLWKYFEINQSKLQINNIEDTYNNILDLDKEYSKVLNTFNDFEEGDFSFEKVVINNLFSFGPEEKEIDLSVEGINGIVGKNRVGKTTLFKIIEFILFNEIPENTSSYKKIINKYNRTLSAYGELYLIKNNQRFVIKRSLIPNKKDGARVELQFKEIDFDGNDIRNLTDEKRQKTELQIIKYFGNSEMFSILSFFSIQKKQLDFIDCKNSKRLELVNRFLGLQSYEQKNEAVKEDLKIKKKIYDIEVKDFDRPVDVNILNEKVQDLENQLLQTNDYISANENILNQLDKNILERTAEIQTLIDIISQEDVSEKLKIKRKEYESKILYCQENRKRKDIELEDILSTKNNKIEKNKEFKLNEELKITEKKKNILIDIEVFNNAIEKHNTIALDERNILEKYNNEFLNRYHYDSKNVDILIKNETNLRIELEKLLSVVKSDIIRLKKQLLSDNCSICKRNFTENDKKDVRNQIGELELQETTYEIQIKEREEIVCTINNEFVKITQKEKNLELIKKEVKILENKILLLNSELKDFDNKLLKVENEYLNTEKFCEYKYQLDFNNIQEKYSKIDKEILEYNQLLDEVKLKIIESEKLEIQIKESKEKLKQLEIELSNVKQSKEKTKNVISLDLATKYSLQQEIKNNKKDIEKYKIKLQDITKLEKELHILDLYKSIVSKDGLPLFILKQRIKNINDEINAISNQIFNFDINFEIDEINGDLNLDFITFEEDEDTKCDISLASSSETFVINLCIKVGLTQLATTPKLKSLIVDEGFGTMDNDNIEHIPMLFKLLLEYYHNVFLISHLDTIKDSYTHQIELVKENNYTTIKT